MTLGEVPLSALAFIRGSAIGSGVCHTQVRTQTRMPFDWMQRLASPGLLKGLSVLHVSEWPN